ncbi:MAG: hypothetical protein ABSA17_01140 [Rhabdochlamydiaceae bacterium]|jgi:hypothetical protein
MHIVSGVYSGNYVWIYRLAGAVAGASITHYAQRTLKLNPWGPYGLVTAGAALAGARVYPMLIDKAILSSLYTRSHFYIHQSLTVTHFAIAFLVAHVAFSHTGARILFAGCVGMLHVPININLIKDYVKNGIRHASEHQIRQLVQVASLRDLWNSRKEVSNNNKIIFANTCAERDDASTDEAIQFISFSSPIGEPLKLSEKTFQKLLAGGMSYVGWLLKITSNDPQKQFKVLEKFRLGPQNVVTERKDLPQHTKEALKHVFNSKSDENIEEFLQIFLDRKHSRFFDAFKMVMRNETPISLSKCSPQFLRRALQTIVVSLDDLHHFNRHNLNPRQAVVVADECAQRDGVFDTLQTFCDNYGLFDKLDWDLKELSACAIRKLSVAQKHKLLFLTASDPQKQIQIVTEVPLDHNYIIHLEEEGFRYPQLADATIDHLMKKQNPSVWEIALCVRQRKALMHKFYALSNDALLLLAGNYRRVSEVCWQSSLIKLVVEAISGETADTFLKSLGTRSVWFKYALRHVLKGKTLLDDETLVEWSETDWEIAHVVVAAKPHLYEKCSLRIRHRIDRFTRPRLAIEILKTASIMLYLPLRTICQAVDIAFSEKQFEVVNKLIPLHQERPYSYLFLNAKKYLSFLVGKSIGIPWRKEHFSYVLARGIEIKSEEFDSLRKDYLEKIIEVKTLQPSEEFKVFYELWHSTDARYFPLGFFFFNTSLPRVQAESCHDVHVDSVLHWLAGAVSKNAFQDVPEFVTELVNYYPEDIGRMIGLWEKSTFEESPVRAERAIEICAALKVIDCSMFTRGYQCSLVDLYKDFKSFFSFFDHKVKFDPAVDFLSRNFLRGGKYHDVGNTDQVSNLSILNNDCIRYLAMRMPVLDRLKLASTCRRMYNLLCGTASKPQWEQVGSLRAVRHMIEVYRLTKDDTSREARIIRRAILQNLPELVG